MKRIPNKTIPSVQEVFDKEIEKLISDGWLVPYVGRIKGTLLLMAVKQKINLRSDQSWIIVV